MLEHLPDRWIAPVVWHLLRENLYFEVVVSAFEHSWCCKALLNIEADHVLPRAFECIVKSLLVFLSLTFSVSNKTVAISNEDEHSLLAFTLLREVTLVTESLAKKMRVKSLGLKTSSLFGSKNLSALEPWN